MESESTTHNTTFTQLLLGTLRTTFSTGGQPPAVDIRHGAKVYQKLRAATLRPPAGAFQALGGPTPPPS